MIFSFVFAERVQSDCGELCTMCIMGKRKHTVISNLYKDSTQISAFEVHEWIHETLHFDEQEGVRHTNRYTMRQVHNKPVTKPLNLDLYQEPSTGLLFTYNNRILKGTSAGLGLRSIRIANLTPPELPNDNILTVLKRCCAPRGFKDRVWTQ